MHSIYSMIGVVNRYFQFFQYLILYSRTWERQIIMNRLPAADGSDRYIKENGSRFKDLGEVYISGYLDVITRERLLRP